MFKTMVIVCMLICAMVVAISAIILTTTIAELRDAIDRTYNRETLEINTVRVNIKKHTNAVDVDDGK